MHGQNMASGYGVTLALCSPLRLLSRYGSMLRCASASVPVEAHSSMRPFTLRQRRLTFRSVSAAGLTLLAYIFKAIPKSSLSPFGFALPPSPDFLSPCEARSSHAARCQVRFRNSSSVFRLSLPSRISRSFGLVVLNRLPNNEACLCESPDFPSLPVAP